MATIFLESLNLFFSNGDAIMKFGAIILRKSSSIHHKSYEFLQAVCNFNAHPDMVLCGCGCYFNKFYVFNKFYFNKFYAS